MLTKDLNQSESVSEILKEFFSQFFFSFFTMLHSICNIHRCSLLLVFAFSLFLILLLNNGYTEASLYHIKGICSYKDKYYKPGESFHRGCDKCICHDFGVYCFAPMMPTSWPRKCRRIRTECSYMVVYKENPKLECRPYSWIG